MYDSHYYGGPVIQLMYTIKDIASGIGISKNGILFMEINYINELHME
jgi:hypothetical protein